MSTAVPATSAVALCSDGALEHRRIGRIAVQERRLVDAAVVLGRDHQRLDLELLEPAPERAGEQPAAAQHPAAARQLRHLLHRGAALGRQGLVDHVQARRAQRHRDPFGEVVERIDDVPGAHGRHAPVRRMVARCAQHRHLGIEQACGQRDLDVDEIGAGQCQHADAGRMGQTDDLQALRIARVGAQRRHGRRQLVDLDRIDAALLGVDHDDRGCRPRPVRAPPACRRRRSRRSGRTARRCARTAALDPIRWTMRRNTGSCSTPNSAPIAYSQAITVA